MANKYDALAKTIFDQIFKKKAAAPACEPLTVYAPAEGTVIPLADFPDPVFSQEALGPGFGILPSGSAVTAPFNGTVTQVIDTLHAVGVTSDDGVELLIHIGVDTVDMGGKGFRALVKNDQKIYKGDTLITFDREVIKEAGHPDAIAVIVTNSDAFAGITLIKTGVCLSGEPVLQAEKN